MQSDSPESDPRLQKVNPGPKVTTGFVDPCLFYLEATLPREIPVLFACWARSSSETRAVNGTIHLKLNHVSVVRGVPLRGLHGWTMQDGLTDWDFNMSQFFQEFQLVRGDSGWVLRCANDLSYFSFDTRYGCQSFLKFIDAETNARLAELNSEGLGSLPDFTKIVLQHGPVEWPTLVNALESFRFRQPLKKRVSEHSIFRRLISSVFTKKSKPVAA